MFGGRRGLVAVLATASVVLGVAQASGIVVVDPIAAPPATPHLLSTAVPPSTGTTDRVSVDNGGGEAAHGGTEAVISKDGRWEIFRSADKLDPSAPNSPAGQIFVRDLTTGATRQLSLGTAAAPGAGPFVSDGTAPNGASSVPAISNSGRFIAFVTSATNIVPKSPTSASALVLCDRDPTGAQNPDHTPALDTIDPNTHVPTNTCVAVDTAAVGTNLDGFHPSIAGGGSRIAWTVTSTSASPKAYYADIHTTGGLHTSAGAEIPHPGYTLSAAQEPVFDGEGIEVVFFALSTDGKGMLLATDVQINPASTDRIDVDPAGGFLGDNAGIAATEGYVQFSSISVGGSVLSDVAFVRTWVQTNIVKFAGGPGAPAAAPHALAPLPPPPRAFVVQQAASGHATGQLVSKDNNGDPVLAGTSAGASPATAISDDGRYAAFTTAAAGAHDGQDAAGKTEVVVRDLVLDADVSVDRLDGALASPAATCATPPTPPAVQCASNGAAVTDLSLDATGARVSFVSDATNLVGGDGNAAPDAFVRTWNAQISDVSTTLPDDVELGDSTVFSVDVHVLGFGPVAFGAPTVLPTGEFTIEGDTCQTFFVQHTLDVCDVSLRFAPTGAVGSRTATIALPSPIPTSLPVEVATVTANVVDATSKSAAGDTVRTSVHDDGSQAASGGSEAMVSGNGRWQVFVSDDALEGRPPTVNNSGDAGANVFVRDLADPERTRQISLHTNVTGATPVTSATHPVGDPTHLTGSAPNHDSFAPSISSNGRFVSFVTRATDVVPFTAIAGAGDPYVLVICDRDPSGTTSNGEPVLDLPRPGTQVPDYACFSGQSGRADPTALGLDNGSLPQLSGDGTRITWVESDGGEQRRVRVATISTAGGKLHAPSAVAYVPNTVGGAGMSLGSTRNPGDGNKDQFYPTLTENGGAVVFVVGTDCGFTTCDAIALSETDLSSGQSTRFDLSDDEATLLGEKGGNFDPPSVSDDGTVVAFGFRNSADNAPTHAYVVTHQVAAPTLVSRLVSRDNRGRPGIGSQAAISGDGRYVAFRSGSPNMHNGVDPANGSCYTGNVHTKVNCQIVARDLVHDERLRRQDPTAWTPSELVSSSITTTCVTALPPGRKCASTAEGTTDYSAQPSDSTQPTLDETGSEIGFVSDADDLVAGDTNFGLGEGENFPQTDAFVHTWRPKLTVPTMNFGSVKLGSSKTRTFKITVTGFGGVPADFGPVSLGLSSILGSNALDFTIVSTTCTGKTLHEGPASLDPSVTAPESCQFKLRFTPQAPGTRTASLSTRVGKNGYPRTDPASNISYDPAILQALTGFGATPVISTSPTLNFGNRRAKDPLTKTLIVTNTGSTALVITTVIVNDTTHPGSKNDYTVSFGDCLPQVAVGASCVISVTFSGSRVGVRDAVMVISSNASGGPTSVGLLARVIKPTIESNPAVSPIRRVITITGTNFAPHHLVEVGFDGVVQDSKKTDAHGSFSLNIVVLPDGPQGPRTLFGHSVGLSPTIRGEFSFLVVLGAGDPGSGDVIRD